MTDQRDRPERTKTALGAAEDMIAKWDSEGGLTWPPLGEAEVALSLERLERAEQDRLAAALAPDLEEAIQSGEGLRADASVGHEVEIILAVAVQGGERAGGRSRQLLAPC